jgi:hypothetical protein
MCGPADAGSPTLKQRWHFPPIEPGAATNVSHPARGDIHHAAGHLVAQLEACA